ncbi:MAG: biotin-dependent carboxyltransferase family protein, partial [Pseudomonadota bacterium]
QATLQDLGRPGFLRQGVPASGALDQPTVRLLNRLVGNIDTAPVIEFLIQGPELVCEATSARLAVANTTAEVVRRDGRRERLRAFLSVTLFSGDSLRVGRSTAAVCGYVGIAGGLSIPPVLSSLSTYGRGRFGGLDGRPLSAGTKLPLNQAEAHGPARVLPVLPRFHHDGPIRVVPGPQADAFTEEATAQFYGEAYTIGPASDRVGLRLDGPDLPHRAGFEVLSEGIAPGSIQVPGTRQPIVLLNDRQTIGGYPKIATVAGVDLARLASKRVGDAVRFKAISRDQAEDLRGRYEHHLDALTAKITEAPPIGAINETALTQVDLTGEGSD